MPDFSARLIGYSQDEDREWSEWRWTGTRTNGGVLDMAGVLVFGIRDDRIAWGRLYIEPVSGEDESIDAAVHKLAGRRPSRSCA